MSGTFYDRLIPRIDFAGWETFWMRLGFAILLMVCFPALSSLPPAGSELPFPNGLQHWIDFSWALEPGAYAFLRIGMFAAAALYVTGFAFPVSATLLFVGYLICGTLQNSLGSISHYYQFMTLLLFGQSLAAWIWALLPPRHFGQAMIGSPTELHSFTTRVTLQVMTGNYVLCALTKLINSKGAWFWNSQYMPMDIAKIEQQRFHNALEPVDMGLGGILGDWVLQHPWLCLFLYAPGLIAELLAFLILFGRKWALVTGLAIVGMHEVIRITMSLDFPQHQWMFFLFAVNAPYWIWRGIQKMRDRRKSAATP